MTPFTHTISTRIGDVTVRGNREKTYGRQSEVHVKVGDLPEFSVYAYLGSNERVDLHYSKMPSGMSSNDSMQFFDNSRMASVEYSLMNCCAFSRLSFTIRLPESLGISKPSPFLVLLSTAALIDCTNRLPERFSSPTYIHVVDGEDAARELNYLAWALGYSLVEEIPSRMGSWTGAPVRVWRKEAVTPREFKNYKKWEADGKELQTLLGVTDGASGAAAGAGNGLPSEPSVPTVQVADRSVLVEHPARHSSANTGFDRRASSTAM